MKNKFKFQNRIFQIACEGKSCCVINGVPCACEDSECEMCDFNNTFECNSQFKAWCNTEEDEVKKTDWSKVKRTKRFMRVTRLATGDRRISHVLTEAMYMYM